ncbi:MAG: hypothetical protein E7645_06145 [Ruminococcaceae bacterium]|nr:hypothetical protein [Oscillospiraceae bacterium]
MGTAIIILAVALPAFIFLYFVNLPRMARLRELASHRYICPSCGQRFRVKWYRLLLVRWQIETTDKATLTCPACKTRDACRRETSIYEEEERI